MSERSTAGRDAREWRQRAFRPLGGLCGIGRSAFGIRQRAVFARKPAIEYPVPVEHRGAALVVSRPLGLWDVRLGNLSPAVPLLDLQANQWVIRVGFRGTVQDQRTIIRKTAATAPGTPLGPQGPSVKPRGTADGGPATLVAGCPQALFQGDIHQQLAVRRQVAFVFVDAAFEPCPWLEGVAGRVPADQVIPVRRTSQQEQRPGCAAGEQDVKSRWGRGAGHGERLSGILMRR